MTKFADQKIASMGQVDMLAFGTHPDDVELYIGGTVVKSVESGQSVGICDLTRGERGSRGSEELRYEEMRTASKLLGLDPDARINLEIEDGNVRDSKENVIKAVKVIRSASPNIMLIPSPRDRHPDHEEGSRLLKRAWFESGLATLELEEDGEGLQPHRPSLLLTYDQAWESEPDLLIDISDQFEKKIEAIRAYGSQFSESDQNRGSGPETYISKPNFVASLISRMSRLGFLAGGEYAEGFSTIHGPITVDSLFTLSQPHKS